MRRVDKKPNAGTQLNAMLQAFPDLLFTLDENGVLLDYKGSKHVSTLFASAEALIGQQLEDVLPSDFAASLRAALQAGQEREQARLVRILDAAGRRRALVRGAPRASGAGSDRGRGPRRHPPQGGRGEGQVAAPAHGRAAGHRPGDLIEPGPAPGAFRDPQPGDGRTGGGRGGHPAAQFAERAGVRHRVGIPHRHTAAHQSAPGAGLRGRGRRTPRDGPYSGPARGEDRISCGRRCSWRKASSVTSASR